MARVPTRCSASRRRPPTTRSRRRTASSRARTIPTRTRATPRPRSGSRRSRARTTRSPTPRSASSSTCSAPTAARPAAARARRRLRLRERRPLRPARPVRRHLRPWRRPTGRPQPERGADLESRVRLSFEDALAGAQVRVPVEVDAACHTCHGTGAEPGTSPITCPQCGGSGTVSDSHGPLRALAAVPALPRQRRHRREAVHDLPRHRAASG